ncbi:MAG: HAD family hydrolase [Acidimicrobiales bacterium]
MGGLVLWDIDGTLVRSNGVGTEAFRRAVEAVVGSAPAVAPPMAGKTDPQIAAEWLAALDHDDGPAVVAQVLRLLESELSAAREDLARRGQALPGTAELLAALSLQGRSQSVCTGNIAPNAAVKLSTFGLDRWLDLEVGAYGSDDPDRRCLVPVALERFGRQRGLGFSVKEVWVVGDTPLDLACAQAAGVRCVLVGTGGSSAAELEGLGADAVVDDLGDVEAMVGLLTR